MNELSPMTLVLLYGLIFLACIFFFVWLPGKKKNKQMQELHQSIVVGDEVVLAAGIIGKVIAREGDIITIELDENGSSMKVIIFAVSTIKSKASR